MLERTTTTNSIINIRQIKLDNPRIIYSLYIPLGENGIIQLVDAFREDATITILDTDLYYFVTIEHHRFEISFYSRGLVKFVYEPREDYLWKIQEEIDSPKNAIKGILTGLLDTYQLSMVSMFDGVENIPIHTTIVTENIRKMDSEYYSSNRDEDFRVNLRKDILTGLADEPKMSEFLGQLRVIGNRKYEDVLIGTRGSLIRTDQLDILVSYHTFVRALHLFLNEYNEIVRELWEDLSEYEESLNDFIIDIDQMTESFRLEDLFSSERRHVLSQIKSEILSGVRNIDQFLVLIKFIRDWIEFTYEKYLEVREASGVKDNSFHIRKVLGTLEDRSKDSAMVSESLVNRANSIVSRLDLLDSEIAYEKQQRFEMITLFSSLVSIFIALIAVMVSFL